jgi:protein dithiol oxidoreductase (disulfide-forming)
MKRMMLGILAAALVLPLAVRAAETFEVGRDYVEVAFPPSSDGGTKIEVREFFWYGCGHCFHFEPTVNAWLKHRPANVEFIRTPGMAPHWAVHAQAFYALENIGMLDKLHEPLFHAVQSGQRLSDESSLADFVASRGVNARKFRDAFNSFGVRMKLDRAQQLNEEFRIDSVPTIVVANKYITAPSMAGGEERTMALVDYLIAKAAKERKLPAGK